jgi:hypothetical protein
MSWATAKAKMPAATSSSMMPVPAGGARGGGWAARFEDVEETRKRRGRGWRGPSRRAEDEGDELAGYLVDDNVAGVFAAGFAGYDGGGECRLMWRGPRLWLCRRLVRRGLGAGGGRRHTRGGWRRCCRRCRGRVLADLLQRRCRGPRPRGSSFRGVWRGMV